MMNIPGLVLTWMAGSNQTYFAMKTLTLLHQYIDFDTQTAPICIGNSSLEIEKSEYLFQFENALSGKILGYWRLSKCPSWNVVSLQVKRFISPMCQLSSSKFYFKENEFQVCFRPNRWINFSQLDINIIHIMPGSILSDKEATDYLHTLIEENNIELVKRMLNDGPQSLITKNKSLLCMVCNKSEEMDETLDTIKILIEKKCDVNQKHSSAQDSIPLRPIQIVAARHKYRTLSILIDAKAQVNFESDSYVWMNVVYYLMNQCPLRLAIHNNIYNNTGFVSFHGDNKIETIKTLINAKCSLKNFSTLNTPILQFALQQYTCFTDDHKVIQLLIEAKANVNDSNVTGDTPLHYAVLLNEPIPYCTLYLLQAKANINQKNLNGETPFWMSVQNELTKYQSSDLKESVKCLIDHKCDVNQCKDDRDEWSPLSKYKHHPPSWKNNHKELFKTLVEAKCVL